MTPDPSWLEIAESAGMSGIALILLAAAIKGIAELLKHKKANDEARIALVNKITDALIEATKRGSKEADKE